jgi:hypothetical protein
MGAIQSLRIDAENYYKVEDHYAMKLTGTRSSLKKIFDSLEVERTASEAISHVDSHGRGRKFVSVCTKGAEVAEKRCNQKNASPPEQSVALSNGTLEERI